MTQMNADWQERVRQEFLRIIERSPLPEDYDHALNVLDWVLRLEPDAGDALRLAALGHDIERAIPERKVRRESYTRYEDFKRAHAENSARVAGEIIEKFPDSGATGKRVVYLIRHHEHGVEGDAELQVLKDADGLSFFSTNLPHYYAREGEEETLFRMRWGRGRLSPRALAYLQRFDYDDRGLRELLSKII